MTDTEKAALERRIDELCAENERLRGTISENNQLAVMSANITRETQDRLRAENAKLRELFNETLIRLVAASEAAGGGFMDARYCELLESHGIEVDG